MRAINTFSGHRLVDIVQDELQTFKFWKGAVLTVFLSVQGNADGTERNEALRRAAEVGDGLAFVVKAIDFGHLVRIKSKIRRNL